MYQARRRHRRPDGAQRRGAPPPDHPLLALQRAAGNQAVANLLAPPRSAKEREVERLDGPDIAALWREFKRAGPVGPAAIDLPNGCFPLTPEEGEQLYPLVHRLKEKPFLDFARERRPLYAAMTTAADPAARHLAIAGLRAYDGPRLGPLVAMRDAIGTWDVDDADARDAVLAAIQLQAATEAMDELAGDTATIRTRVIQAAGMSPNDDWCGFFSADHYVSARMDNDLRAGFMHTIDVEGFFTYHPRDDLPERVKRWIWDGAAWHSLRDYHAQRGSPRQWLTEEQIVVGGRLDIRPGDTVLMDWAADGGPADHIALVASYDPGTSTLITLGGNDSGYTVRPPGAPAPGADATRDKAEAATGLELRKPGGEYHVAVGAWSVTAVAGKPRGIVYGIGRPSLVDFEEHRYAGTPLDKPPPPLKAP